MLKLTLYCDGTPIFINPFFIVALEKAHRIVGKDSTYVSLVADSTTYEVEESPEQIIELIAQPLNIKGPVYL